MQLRLWGRPNSLVRSQELIFVSKKAVYKPPKAIRGGVPVCFPQFGGFGPLQQHGFARNTAFEVVSGTLDSVTLALRPDTEQLKLFLLDAEACRLSEVIVFFIKCGMRILAPYKSSSHTIFAIYVALIV